jgi:hypothetical protein
MRHTTTLLAACLLAVAGCSSSGGEDEPAKTITVTASPSLSEAEARQACVDAWRAWFDNEPDDYDPDTDPLPELPACDGRRDNADLAIKAWRQRIAENLARFDACTEDPASCTEDPVP